MANYNFFHGFQTRNPGFKWQKDQTGLHLVDLFGMDGIEL
jgi:hypothetical protein